MTEEQIEAESEFGGHKNRGRNRSRHKHKTFGAAEEIGKEDCMSFFSNIFTWLGKEEELPPSPQAVPGPLRSRKRNRDSGLSCGGGWEHGVGTTRPVKVFRGETRNVPVSPPAPLECLPDDVLSRCLLFVGGVEDRFAVQTTCKTFQRLSNRESNLQLVDVKTILLDEDTVETATKRITPFAAAGNLQALYMLGIIGTYTHCDVERGIGLLKAAADRGYIQASYASGIILRDSEPGLASQYMATAAKADYLPALQELLTANEMKTKRGEVGAEELRRHLDPCCLNRLLARHYCSTTSLRKVHTSHCWNALCGRWAFRGGRKNRVSRMKMCSRCCRAKYCSKLCQVYDWRSGRHKLECQHL